MANSDRVPNEVKSFLRSVLVSSKGVKESRVQNDYRELIGEKLMWRNYGFNSLNEFLKAIPDVCTLEYNSKDKENRVYAVHVDGIYMSSHAKKNVKETAPDKTPAKQLEDGRFIQTDGEMGLKITLTNNNVDARKAGHFEDGIQPNKNGKYQVYVTMLPESCTEADVRDCFRRYGNVCYVQVMKSSIGKKIAFVNYAVKTDAERALVEGINNPPVVHGMQLVVGKTKRKSDSSNSSDHSEISSTASESSLSSIPSSPLKPLSPPPTSVPIAAAQLPNSSSCSQPTRGNSYHKPTTPHPPQSKFHSTQNLTLHNTISQYPQPIPQTVHNTLSQTLHNTIPQSTRNTIPQTVRNTIPQSTHNTIPHTLHSVIPQTLHNAVPQNTHNTASQPPHDIIPQINHKTIAQATHNAKPPIPHNSTPKTNNFPYQQYKHASSELSLSPLAVQAPNQPSQSPYSSPFDSSQYQRRVGTNGNDAINSKHGVIISGYSNKFEEENLRNLLQNVCEPLNLEWGSGYSIVTLKSADSVTNLIETLKDKVFFGEVLMTKPLIKNHQEVSRLSTSEMGHDDKLPGRQNTLTTIYEIFSEAVNRCYGKRYANWMENLPQKFEIKIMELIDPCTFWLHVADGSTDYQVFNDVSLHLSTIKLTSDSRHLSKGKMGAGKFSEDGCWYRCYCCEESADLKNVRVMYIDYGNTEWLSRDQTVLINDDLFELRPQGVLAKFSGLKYEAGGTATDENIFVSAKKILHEKVFTARKVATAPSQPLLLDVELLGANGEQCYKELSCLRGVKKHLLILPSVASVLLSIPPPVPEELQPIKSWLCDVDKINPIFIWITDIRSPSCFYFQLVNERSKRDIKELQEILLRCNVQNKINMKGPNSTNILYCYHKNGHERSRVSITSDSFPQGKVRVLHVDTGKEALVPLTSFFDLPPKARQAQELPFQARPAHMYGVSHDAFVNSTKALEFIISQATQVLRAVVVKENYDESVVLELFDAQGDSLNKLMLNVVDNCPSTPPNIPGLSKQNFVPVNTSIETSPSPNLASPELNRFSNSQGPSAEGSPDQANISQFHTPPDEPTHVQASSKKLAANQVTKPYNTNVGNEKDSGVHLLKSQGSLHDKVDAQTQAMSAPPQIQAGCVPPKQAQLHFNKFPNRDDMLKQNLAQPRHNEVQIQNNQVGPHQNHHKLPRGQPQHAEKKAQPYPNQVQQNQGQIQQNQPQSQQFLSQLPYNQATPQPNQGQFQRNQTQHQRNRAQPQGNQVQPQPNLAQLQRNQAQSQPSQVLPLPNRIQERNQTQPQPNQVQHQTSLVQTQNKHPQPQPNQLHYQPIQTKPQSKNFQPQSNQAQPRSKQPHPQRNQPQLPPNQAQHQSMQVQHLHDHTLSHQNRAQVHYNEGQSTHDHAQPYNQRQLQKIQGQSSHDHAQPYSQRQLQQSQGQSSHDHAQPYSQRQLQQNQGQSSHEHAQPYSQRQLQQSQGQSSHDHAQPYSQRQLQQSQSQPHQYPGPFHYDQASTLEKNTPVSLNNYQLPLLSLGVSSSRSSPVGKRSPCSDVIDGITSPSPSFESVSSFSFNNGKLRSNSTSSSTSKSSRDSMEGRVEQKINIVKERRSNDFNEDVRKGKNMPKRTGNYKESEPKSVALKTHSSFENAEFLQRPNENTTSNEIDTNTELNFCNTSIPNEELNSNGVPTFFNEGTSLNSKLNEQKKVLTRNGTEQQKMVQDYRSKEKASIIEKIKALERENALLQEQIKQNLREKAELERDLSKY
ncbi:uncharacterized protein LOC124447961 isoform X3 [Xenia sp. Carnegie-2017]|uniref:uncharacterized protein LOC124447961 isoform X3 n=1 Tax=Xenia sp. Carnegie-2017 TaxID=2897299 RepID=UPI001F045DC0|nr:uncharacterized protein LOC124447961 isoform X3 [Xenia sp. Carnegie-2017]